MRTVSLVLLVALVAGCAHVNRWRGDFYGVATQTEFVDDKGTRVTGVLVHVNRAERLKAIGHDNKYLPTQGFSAVLLNRTEHLLAPNSVPTNIDLIVTGELDTTVPRSTHGEPLRQLGIPADAFKPSLRVKKIRPVEPTPSLKSNALQNS